MKPIRHRAPKCVFVLLAVVGAAIIPPEALSNLFQSPSLAAQPSLDAARSHDQYIEPNATEKARISQSYGKLPMLFEANRDQTDARVKFIARGGGYSLFLTDNEAVLRLRIHENGLLEAGDDYSLTEFTNPQSEILFPQSTTHNPQSAILNARSTTLRMKFVGASRNPRVSGVEKLQTTSNYFVGDDHRKWRTNITNFAKVKYEAFYPGIDVVWYGNQRQIEHDFIIAPGADPKRIKLSFAEADAVTIDGEGALVLRVDGEEFRLLKPVAWQEVDGKRLEIACDYSVVKKEQIGFRIGEYDRGRTLVIDPVLAYSTYIGGAGLDQASDIAVDGDGFAYITGVTDSSDFPGPSPIQMAKGAQTDVFVLKLNPAGDAVVFGAWLGGAATEVGNEIAVDATGSVVVTGVTSSNDFPTKNALQPVRKGGTEAFVAKLNSAGNDLIYSTYLGGSLADNANALAVDAIGNAYLTGITDSIDFPLKGAFLHARQDSAFYTSDNSGNGWMGSGAGLFVSQVFDIAIDPSNPATIYAGTDRGVFKSVNGGATWSLAGAPFNLLTFQIVIDPTAPANVYALTQTFIYKSSNGGDTWIPIQFPQSVQAIAISPTTPAATIYAATSTAFLKSDNGGINWTPIGLPPIGGIAPRVFSIIADSVTPTTVYAGAINGVYRSVDGGSVWTPLSTGFPQDRTFSVSRLAISRSNPAMLLAEVFNFGAFKTTNGGSDWTAVGLPTPVTTRLTFAIDPIDPNTIYAGTPGFGIYKSVDGGVTWNTANNGLNNHNVRVIAVAPTSPSTIYAGTSAGPDAFVTKINPAGSELVFSSYLGGGGGDTGVGIAIDQESNVYVTGSTESQNFPAINAYQPTLNGLLDAFVTKINPSGSAILWSTFLGGAGPENGNDIAVHPQGSVLVTGTTGSTNFPTANAIQSVNRSVIPATADAFVSRFSGDGSGVEFSTYLGGSGSDFAVAISVDSVADVHLTGSTNSNDFPVLKPVQAMRGGDPQFPFTDAFVTKLGTNGAGLIYSTYLGGSASDQGTGVATDGIHNTYVTGTAFSSDFPTTPNPLRASGFNDSFVSRLEIRADLAIVISELPDPVMINNDLTYTLTVTNKGPDAAQGVIVTDTLPAGVDLVSTNASRGSCGSSNPITCSIGSIAPNDAATVRIVVKPTATGSITNSATVMSATPDATAANNTATQETRVTTIPSIFGRVTTGSGAGLSDVSVALSGAQRPSATTANDGGYQFAELPAGSNYTVTPSRQGFVFNPPNRSINNLQADQRADFQAVSCVFSISPRNQTFTAIGGVGSVTITSPDSRCPWTAISREPWIKITSVATGNGNGVLTFNVEPTVGSRIGAITVAGNTFTVSQEFNACDSVIFKTPRVLTVSSSQGTLSRLTAKDFNNDGVSDLIYFLNQPEGGIAISLSNNTGGYETGRTVYNGLIRSFRAGDLNNDGKNDLALVTNEATARLLMLFGDGAGGFSAPVNLETSRGPLVTIIADFNNDNKPDIAVGTNSLNPPMTIPTEYNVSIHLGDGAGGFGAPKNTTINTSAGSFLTQIETGDFNGDGNSDLAILSFFGSTVILYGDGSGNFTKGNLSFFGTNGGMTKGDFNGDGKTDIAISRDGDIFPYLSTDAGPLQPVQPLRTATFGSGIVAADFNGDGRSDIAAPGGVGVLVLFATRDGGFTEPESYSTGGASGPIVLGDFNRDGRDELFVTILPASSSSTRAEIAILTVNAQGLIDAPRSSKFVEHFSSISSEGVNGPIALTDDLNGDGVLDLVVGFRRDSWRVSIVPGNGRGEFVAPLIYNIFGSASDFSIRDLNRDGKPDIVFMSNGSDFRRVAMLLNDGAGGFTEKTSVNLGSFTYSNEFADFNGDGILDLIVSNQVPVGTNGLNLYLGDGGGDFTKSPVTFNVNTNAARVVVGDFNGDRNPDLLIFRADQSVCGPGANPLSIIFGDGRGGFSSSINLNLNERIASVERADINLDGRTDLIFINTCPENRGLFVMLADPQGGFLPPVKNEINTTGVITLVKDFNNDGKLDVMLKGAEPDVYFFFLGKSDGEFSPGGSFKAPAYSVAAGDFNGDGAIDLVLPRTGSEFAAVLPSQGSCAKANFATITSAASYAPFQSAPESIAALFGANLAMTTQFATLPLPTMLAGSSVRIKDSAGIERLSPLFFVSPSQINHLIPKDSAIGAALITVTNGANNVATGTALITSVSPGLFSADSSGQGLAAAVVLRVRQDNSQVYEPMVRFDPAQNRFVAIPIDLSDGSDQVFLILFGTGMRNRSGLAKVNAKIGDVNAEVSFAGSQGELDGLDQVNLRLSPALRGSGDVSVELVVDGKAANPIMIKIK